jgi:hypothetical protein
VVVSTLYHASWLVYHAWPDCSTPRYALLVVSNGPHSLETDVTLLVWLSNTVPYPSVAALVCASRILGQKGTIILTRSWEFPGINLLFF